MLGSIPHQKFCFYHLPTRGRAGIKLGDAWYISNVSIIFDCSMLLYILFWMFNGLIYTLLYFFKTNLVTGGPAQIAVFLPILVFHRKLISNGVQTEWNHRERDFWNKRDPEDLEWTSSNQRGSHEERGRAYPPGRTLHPRGPLVAPPTYFFHLYIIIYHENIREHHETLFPLPQPSVPARSHLGAFSSAPSEGELITEGFYINTIASPMMCE